jgi:hypothetical protein
MSVGAGHVLFNAAMPRSARGMAHKANEPVQFDELDELDKSDEPDEPDYQIA